MPKTQMEIVGDSDKADKVREFLESVGWKITSQKSINPELKSPGKLQALTILENEGTLRLKQKMVTLAARVKDNSVLFCLSLKRPEINLCGIVPMTLFRRACHDSRSVNLARVVLYQFVNSHLLDSGKPYEQVNFDDAIKVLDLDDAQEWVGFTWD